MALAFRVAALGLVLGTTHHLDAGRRP
jgi:hypothetical protein